MAQSSIHAWAEAECKVREHALEEFLILMLRVQKYQTNTNQICRCRNCIVSLVSEINSMLDWLSGDLDIPEDIEYVAKDGTIECVEVTFQRLEITTRQITKWGPIDPLGNL